MEKQSDLPVLLRIKDCSFISFVNCDHLMVDNEVEHSFGEHYEM